jgi:hypothetical protein
MLKYDSYKKNVRMKKKKRFEKEDCKKKSTMYCKGKMRGSSPVYKANVLLVYFIKQNITCFAEFFSFE